MRRKILQIIFILALSFSGWSVALPATASAAQVNSECSSTFLVVIPNWYKYLQVDKVASGQGDAICQVTGPCVDRASGTDVPDDQCNSAEQDTRLDIPEVILRVLLALVDILLRLAGVIAVGFITYGGVLFVLSTGDPAKAKAARETVMNACIGLAIAILATGIVAFIGNTLIK